MSFVQLNHSNLIFKPEQIFQNCLRINATFWRIILRKKCNTSIMFLLYYSNISNKRFKKKVNYAFSDLICAGGQSHWCTGACFVSGSHGFQPSIFLANVNSFSACIINSSTWPQPIFFSNSSTFGVYNLAKKEIVVNFLLRN